MMMHDSEVTVAMLVDRDNKIYWLRRALVQITDMEGREGMTDYLFVERALDIAYEALHG